MAYTSKGLLHNFLPDVWISTDGSKGSPILSICLTAETTTGCVISSEFSKGEESTIANLEAETPEEIGNLATISLLDDIQYKGCVDLNNQTIPLYLMVLGQGR